MNFKRGPARNAYGKAVAGGFTLIELMVVVAIIAILAAIVIASLNNAKTKGGDGGVKSNLRNAISKAEIFYNTNTDAPNTYTGVCTNGVVGGATGIGSFVLAAAQARGLSSYAIGGPGGNGIATCTESDLGDAWRAEVPLSSVGKMWCVDSTGVSKENNGSTGFGWACNF